MWSCAIVGGVSSVVLRCFLMVLTFPACRASRAGLDDIVALLPASVLKLVTLPPVVTRTFVRFLPGVANPSKFLVARFAIGDLGLPTLFDRSRGFLMGDFARFAVMWSFVSSALSRFAFGPSLFAV